MRTASMANPEASVSRKNGLACWGWQRIGSDKIVSLSWSKATWQAVVQSKLESLQVRLWRGHAMAEKPGTNFHQKFIAPRKDCTSWTLRGMGQSRMDCALAGEIAICPADM